MGGSRSGSKPVKYYATVEQVICMSPVDAIVEVEINDEKAYTDPITESKTFYIDKPSLFGGDKSEGGVQGWCEARFGEPWQGKSSYLAEKISDVLSATRGVLSVVAKDFYLGNNPYPKPWNFRVKSTLKNFDYSDNWYKEKATIFYSGYTDGESRLYKNIDLGYYLNATSNRTDDLIIGYKSDTADYQTLAFGESLWVDVFNAKDFTFAKDGRKLTNTKRVMNGGGVFPVPSDQNMQVVFPLTQYSSDYYDTTYFTNLNYTANCTTVATVEFDLPSGLSSWLDHRRICQNNGCHVIGLYNSQTDEYSVTWNLGYYGVDTYGHYGAITVKQPKTGTVTNVDYDCVFTDGVVAYYAYASSFVMIYGYTNPQDNGYQKKETHSHSVEYVGRFIAFGVDSDNTITYTLTERQTYEQDENEEYHTVYTYTIHIFQSATGDLIEEFDVLKTFDEREDNGYFLLTKSYMVCIIGTHAIVMNRASEEYDDYDGSQLDYNPAHAIREAITSKVWGLGKDESVIDDANFKTVADTLYAEKIGISYVFESDSKVTDFIEEVMKIVGGTLRIDRSTGLVQIKLFRDDYDPSELLVFDTSNVLEIGDVKRTALSECINQVTCKYKNYKTGDDASIVYQDLALMQAQGEIINADLNYDYVYWSKTAEKLAQRDLFELSSQFFSCKITVGLVGRFLNLGDCIKLNFPHLGINNLVFRVMKITYGGSNSNEISMELTQDKFYMPESAGYVQVGGDDGDTSPLPPQISYSKLFELPYYVAYKFGIDVNGMLSSSSENGVLGNLVSAYKATRITGVSLYTTADEIQWSWFGNIDKNQFVPTCVITTELNYLDDVVYFGNASQMDLVSSSYIGIIDDEIVAIGDVDVKHGSVSIARGMFDTVPQKHGVGSVMFFFSFGNTGLYNSNILSAGDYKFKLPYTSDNGEQNLVDTDKIDVTFDSRAYRPYPPACVKIGNDFFPDLKQYDLFYNYQLSWKARNRLTQVTDQYTLWTDTTDITAESNTYYEITMSNKSGSISYTYVTQSLSTSQSLPCDIELYARIALRTYRLENGSFVYCSQPVIIEGESREATLQFGLNNKSNLILTKNYYYPITATINDNNELIVSVNDGFGTEFGVDEDGTLYRLVEM